MCLRCGRDQDNYTDSTFQCFSKSRGYRGHRDSLVLNVDAIPSRVNGKQVLIEDRMLTAEDSVRVTSGGWISVAIPTGMDIPLDLQARFTASGRETHRECKLVMFVMTPSTVVQWSLACFIPTLHEIMVHICCRWTGYLDIRVMAIALGMAGSTDSLSGQVDPADEGDFSWLARIDQPAFLMMQVMCVCPIPPRTEPRSASRQH